jgi:hypothetical protein
VDYVVWDRKTPWRQGKLITADDCIRLKLCSEEESVRALIIVASHDCDLTQLPNSEPNVEVIIGKITTDVDGNLSHAKNTRRLQLGFDGETRLLGEFEAIRKTTVSKASLAGFEPRKDLTLSPENVNTFQLWLASRYRRSAFPDEFEEKLKDAKLIDKISKAVKPHAEDISGVFFDVDEGREMVHIDADDTYQLDIIILYPAEPTPEKSQKAAEEVQKKINDAFKTAFNAPYGKWQYIELRYSDVVSEEALTYKQFKQLKRWRLDHISLVAIPQQAPIAE